MKAYLSTGSGNDTVEVSIDLREVHARQPVDLNGKTASCQIELITPLPLTSNPNDQFYFRTEVVSGDSTNANATKYGVRVGSKSIQTGQWFPVSVPIDSHLTIPDDSPHFSPKQVVVFAILLKTSAGSDSLFNRTEIEYKVDDCKIE